MKILKACSCFAIANALMGTPPARAAAVDDRYQFTPSTNCELFKNVNRNWEKANADEVGHVEAFLLHEVHNHPDTSSFYANHEMYSALTKCFAAVGTQAASEKLTVKEPPATLEPVAAPVAAAAPVHEDEAKLAESKATEAKAAELKANEAKEAEAKATELKAAEAKAAEAKAAEAKVAETKAAEAKAAELKAAEAKDADAKAAEAKIAEQKATETKDAEAKAAAQKEESKKASESKEVAHEEEEEEAESEFLHQAKAHVFEVTPSLGLFSTTVNYKDLETSSGSSSGTISGFLAEFGINKNISFGASFLYDHFSTSTEPAQNTNPTLSGFEDPKFFVNGKLEFPSSSLRLNFLLNTPFTHHTTQMNSDENVATGRFVFTPALGYEFHSDGNIFGAQIADELIKSDSNAETLTGDTTFFTKNTQGGKAFILSLFYEHRLSEGEWGLSFQYLKASQTIEDGIASDNSGSIITVTLYGEIELSKKISLLPALTYAESNFQESSENENINNVNTFGVNVGARFKF